MVDISDLIGIPYKIHGRNQDGVDCFGLIWFIASRNGTPIKDPVYKGFDPSLIKLAHYIGLKRLLEFEVGCVLEMRKDERLHIGYAIENNRFIHATYNEGVIVEEIGKYPVIGYWTF